MTPVEHFVVVLEARFLELTQCHLRIALCYFILKTFVFIPPQAIVMKMYGHRASDDVIPTPETTDVLGVGSEFLDKTQDDQYSPQGLSSTRLNFCAKSKEN